MKQLFKLLQLGLQITDASSIDISEFATLSKEEWTTIKEIAVKQSVSAVVLDGVNQLPIGYHHLSTEMKLEWIGEALQIEQRNRQQTSVMNEMASHWRHGGCRIMVMKGLANGVLYPHPEHRSPGDIDCYLINDNDNHNRETYRIGNDIARAAGANVDESWYKHSVISYKGGTFENHQFFVTTRSVEKGKLLEKELKEELNTQTEFLPLSPLTVIPPVQWTAMFLTYHSCSHFMSEGLRLKQLLDWAMFLDKHQNDVDWERFYSFCERHYLGRFADVSTAIARNYLGVSIDNQQIRVEGPYTERVLHAVFHDNDFVFGSGKGDWHNRLHLIKNLWTYRWKYRDIYQMSPLRKLWYYATGFIFKTE